MKGQVLFKGEIITKIEKNVVGSFKNLLLQNHWANFNQTYGTNYPWVEGIQVCSYEGDSPSPRGDNSERVKILKFFF
jgi:hypothetical protein